MNSSPVKSSLGMIKTKEKIEVEIQERFHHALQKFSQNNFNEGIKDLNVILKEPLVDERMPEMKFQCFYNLAIAHEELKDIQQAIYFYFRCVKIKENDFNLWLKLANLCFKNSFLDQAEYCFQMSLKTTPSFIYENIIYEQMTYLAFTQKKYDVCLQRIQFLLDRNQIKPEILYLKGIVMDEKGNKFESEKLKSDALGMNPKLNLEQLHYYDTLRKKNDMPITLIESEFANQEKGLEISPIFEMKIDRLKWDKFLKQINELIKITKSKVQNKGKLSKLRKSKLVNNYCEFAEKFQMNIWSVPMKLYDKKETKQIVSDNESGDDNEIKTKKVDNPNKIQNPIGNLTHSMRLQEMQTQKNIFQGSLESALRKFFKCDNESKGSQKSKEKQIKFNKNQTYDKILELFIADFIEHNHIRMQKFIFLDPTFLTSKSSHNENVNLVMSIEEKSNGFSDTKANSILTTKAFDEDFEVFMEQHKSKLFLSLFHLCEAIIKHFTCNKKRNLSKSLGNYSQFHLREDTLSYCPSYFLQGNIKRIIVKFYIFVANFAPSFIDDFNNLLTIFELLVDYYEYWVNLPKNKAPKSLDKLQTLKHVMKFVCNKLMLMNNNQLNSNDLARPEKHLELRAAFALAKYFTLEHFKDTEMAKECLAIISYLTTNTKEFTNINLQMAESGSGGGEGTGSGSNIYLNIFWTKDHLLDQEHIEIVSNKIKDNETKENIPESKNESMIFQELKIIYDIFDEKKKSTLDTAIDLYYKKIFESMLQIDLRNFILFLTRIMTIIMDIIKGKSDNEENKNILASVYQKLKMNEFWKHFLKFLEDKKNFKSLLKKDTEAKQIAIELEIMLFKLILVNIMLGFILDQDLMFSCFVKLGYYLTLIFKKKYRLSSFKFFKLMHFIIHLTLKKKDWHVEVVKTSFRQEVTFLAFKFIDENSTDDDSNLSLITEEDENPSLVTEVKNEMCKIYSCWFGIENLNKHEQLDKKDEKESISPIKNFKDLVLLMKFIRHFHKNYLDQPSSKMKISINKLLRSIYDYLQGNPNEWCAICLGFSKMTNIFEEKLNKGELRLNNVQDCIDFDMNDESCFCEQKNCFKKPKKIEAKDFKQTFAYMFYLVGKAYDDNRAVGEVQNDTAKNIKYLKRIYRMYLLNACLFNRDPYGILMLTTALLDRYILSCDEIIYLNFDNEKIIDSTATISKVSCLLDYALELAKNENLCKVGFSKMKISESEKEASMYKKLILLLQLVNLNFSKFMLKENEEKYRIAKEKSYNLYSMIYSYGFEIKNSRELYIILQFAYNNVKWEFTVKKNKDVLIAASTLLDLIEKDDSEFDKQYHPMYLLEAETLENEILFKIIRRYIMIIKVIRALILKKEDKPGKKAKLMWLERYFFNEIADFLMGLEGSENIKLEKDLFGKPKDGLEKTTKPGKANDSMEIESEPEEEIDITSYMRPEFETEYIIKHKNNIINLINEKLMAYDQNKQLFEMKPDVDYDQLTKRLGKLLTYILKRFKKIIHKKQVKKVRGSPFHGKCVLYASFIFEEYYQNQQKAFEIINEIISPTKQSEIVDLYKNEKDHKFTFLYSRDTVYLKLKYKIAQNYLDLFTRITNVDNLEKLKSINRKAMNMISIEDKQKPGTYKINLIYLKIYEKSLWLLLDYIQVNLSKFHYKIRLDENLMNQQIQITTPIDKQQDKDNNNNLGQILKEDFSKLNLSVMFDENQKTELKLLYEIIQNNIKSKTMIGLIKQNQPLFDKIEKVILAWFGFYVDELFLQISEIKLDKAIGFLDCIFKRKKAGKKENVRNEEESDTNN